MVVTRVSGQVRSLRARLVGTVLLLFTVACVAIGVATTLSLDRYLSTRQDRELSFSLEGFVAQQTGRAPGRLTHDDGTPTPGGQGGGPPGGCSSARAPARTRSGRCWTTAAS
ncbi:Osmosensitive K+ channel histidine kinase KdpD [Pseudonocardia sp. Ae717_Ps2]|uniref:hypothetical protein n=1 Tax=Pseudonocardia sp. Ae717_Ps2 TaxID=1885573 RepID=UPI00095DD551|nr:hypothetical protein [Pseudonocardia sp. Ae717_Ps2]OLM30161.1 Osmosensitive K+ channel histidine kinase KdpD [Pseudonocardia sp. Ae717_Ps2]